MAHDGAGLKGGKSQLAAARIGGNGSARLAPSGRPPAPPGGGARLGYQVVSESAGPDGVPVRRVLFVVAYRDLVDGYATACKHAGLRLVGVDLEAVALPRALPPFADP